jgi:aminopeptidase
MLEDPRIRRMAETLIDYSLGVQKGWRLTIFAGINSMPLVQSAYKVAIERGAHPGVILEVPGATEMMLKHGSDEQLTYVDPCRLALVKESDAILRIKSDDNTRALNEVPPERQGLLAKGQGPMGAAYMQRITDNRPHCLTLFPNHAFAQDAEMSLQDFEDFVFHACFLDEEDPVARWKELSAYQQQIVDWLAGKKNLHVEGPETDLRMSIEGRTFINSDGKRNFPSGEVFTSPVESTVEGRIYFSYPASHNGRSVSGVRLTFNGGEVTESSAEAGEQYLQAMLKLDKGASRLGEFAIGTNPNVTRLTRNILFDEKIAGTIHCALGNAYPNAGGTNKSAIHWDMVTDMREGRITVDGDLLYENGEFVI